MKKYAQSVYLSGLNSFENQTLEVFLIDKSLKGTDSDRFAEDRNPEVSLYISSDPARLNEVNSYFSKVAKLIKQHDVVKFTNFNSIVSRFSK